MAPVGKIGHVIGEIGKIVTHTCFYVLKKMVVSSQEKTTSLILRFRYCQHSGFTDNIPFSNNVKVSPFIKRNRFASNRSINFNLST